MWMHFQLRASIYTHPRNKAIVYVCAAHKRKRKRHVDNMLLNNVCKNGRMLPRILCYEQKPPTIKIERKSPYFLQREYQWKCVCSMQMMRHFRSEKKRRSKNKVRHTKDTQKTQPWNNIWKTWDMNDRTKEILDGNIIRIFFLLPLLFPLFSLSVRTLVSPILLFYFRLCLIDIVSVRDAIINNTS